MIEKKRIIFRSSILLVGAAGFSLLIAAVLYFQPAGAKPPRVEPIDVVKNYLKARYARDYQNAYRYISSRDQLVWNEVSYVSQSESFAGFALELARNLAESMEVWLIEKQLSSDRAHYKIGYRVPTADELSAVLFDWDPGKLNALARPRQEQLLESLGKMKKDGKMIMIEGQETVDLVLDEGGWKVFLDWASGIRVILKVDSASSEVEARFVQNELIVKMDEPFQIDLKIKNRSTQPVVARIDHRIEPREMENHLDMIVCGALRPLALQSGDVQQISSAYVIRDGIRAGEKINITYELKLESLSPNRVANSKTVERTLQHSANGA